MINVCAKSQTALAHLVSAGGPCSDEARRRRCRTLRVAGPGGIDGVRCGGAIGAEAVKIGSPQGRTTQVVRPLRRLLRHVGLRQPPLRRGRDPSAEEMTLNAMRGRRFLWIAAGALAILLIGGYGAGTLVPNPTVASGSNGIATTATFESTTMVDEFYSARYCQRVQSGAWVTNDSAYSTTPCVPDPSYATGDQVADGSQAIPRCFTCKLSDWEHAEKRKARHAQGPSDGTTNADITDPDGWSPPARDQVLGVCTSGLSGSRTLCDCVANLVVQQIPAYEASWLSSDSPTLQAAAHECDPSGQEP